jgi:CrcB protein
LSFALPFLTILAGTFSAFSLDAARLYERGEIGLAQLYVPGSVVFSIAGLFAGLALVRRFT